MSAHLTIHQRINALMKSLNLNYRTFGNEIGVSDVVVRNIITGRNAPSFDFIRRIVQTYVWVNTEWLIKGDGEIKLQNQMNNSNFITNEPEVECGDNKCPNCSKLESKINELKDKISKLKDDLIEAYKPYYKKDNSKAECELKDK
jgi:transcriptional regulator with XRE-family HTH domain